MDAKKFVFKVKDVPLWETADGEMRDQFMITDGVCGANDLTGGLYWMRPQYRGHEDVHTFDEAFYAISGRAQFVADDEPFDVEPGDVIFCPAGVKHRFDNPYDTPYHGPILDHRREVERPRVDPGGGRVIVAPGRPRQGLASWHVSRGRKRPAGMSRSSASGEGARRRIESEWQ